MADNPITVSANAADDSGITSVQFKDGGLNLGVFVTTAPYSKSVTLAAGTHVLTAVAADNGSGAPDHIGFCYDHGY